MEKLTLLELLEAEWKIKIGEESYSEGDFKEIDSKIMDKILSPQAIA